MARQPASSDAAKSGLEPGSTPSTDDTRRPDRPIDEEDVFGGHERTHKNGPVKSTGEKP